MADLSREAIDELTKFRQSSPHGSTWNWLNVVSDVSVAAAFGKLFWPDFVQRDGGVFLRELFSEATYSQWKDQLGTDIRGVERVMNHVHVYDLFLNPKFREPDARAVLYLAGLLGKLWSLRAAEEFGAGRVVVDLLDEEPPGTDPVLVLYQDIPSTAG